MAGSRMSDTSTVGSTQQAPDTTVSVSAPKNGPMPPGQDPNAPPMPDAVLIHRAQDGTFMAEALRLARTGLAPMGAPQKFPHYFDLEQYLSQEFQVPQADQGDQGDDSDQDSDDDQGDDSDVGGSAGATPSGSQPSGAEMTPSPGDGSSDDSGDDEDQ